MSKNKKKVTHSKKEEEQAKKVVGYDYRFFSFGLRVSD